MINTTSWPGACGTVRNSIADLQKAEPALVHLWMDEEHQGLLMSSYNNVELVSLLALYDASFFDGRRKWHPGEEKVIYITSTFQHETAIGTKGIDKFKRTYLSFSFPDHQAINYLDSPTTHLSISSSTMDSPPPSPAPGNPPTQTSHYTPDTCPRYPDT